MSDQESNPPLVDPSYGAAIQQMLFDRGNLQNIAEGVEAAGKEFRETGTMLAPIVKNILHCAGNAFNFGEKADRKIHRVAKKALGSLENWAESGKFLSPEQAFEDWQDLRGVPAEKRVHAADVIDPVNNLFGNPLMRTAGDLAAIAFFSGKRGLPGLLGPAAIANEAFSAENKTPGQTVAVMVAGLAGGKFLKSPALVFTAFAVGAADLFKAVQLQGRVQDVRATPAPAPAQAQEPSR